MFKILHLPTATYLYHYNSNEGDLFTEYEYTTCYKKQVEAFSNIFDTLNTAETYISTWVSRGNIFCWSETEETELRREHLEIIKVRDV